MDKRVVPFKVLRNIFLLHYSCVNDLASYQANLQALVDGGRQVHARERWSVLHMFLCKVSQII